MNWLQFWFNGGRWKLPNTWYLKKQTAKCAYGKYISFYSMQCFLCAVSGLLYLGIGNKQQKIIFFLLFLMKVFKIYSARVNGNLIFTVWVRFIFKTQYEFESFITTHDRNSTLIILKRKVCVGLENRLYRHEQFPFWQI